MKVLIMRLVSIKETRVKDLLNSGINEGTDKMLQAV